MIPFNDLRRVTTREHAALTEAIHRVLHSGNFLLGPETQAFETEFAAFCSAGSKLLLQCVSVANGSDALVLALLAAGVKPGDRVITCANAAMYASLAILATGASPLYVDIDDTHTLDAAHFAACASSGVAAVVVTHLYGRIAAMDSIQTIAAEHGIHVIEDCSQAHGATLNGQRAGSFGDFATFSFYPTKNLGALGDGGAVLCKTEASADRLRALRQYGWSRKYRNDLAGGCNSRMDEIQAAVLSSRLPALDANNAIRRAIAMRYQHGIRHADLHVLPIDQNHAAHLCVLETPRRDALQGYLHAHGIGCEVHYPVPDYQQAVMRDRYHTLTLPRTERAAQEVLSLPCFPDLLDAEVERVIAVLNAWT